MQSVILTTGLGLNLKSKKKTKKMGKEFQINVAALKSQLLQRRSTRPRFKWDFTKDAAADILLAAYMAEVEHRGREFVDDPRLRACIAKTASHVTEGKKFGLMFCGTCGNGKTTGQTVRGQKTRCRMYFKGQCNVFRGFNSSNASTAHD